MNTNQQMTDIHPIVIDGCPYYKIAQISKLTGISEKAIRRWIANGELDHFIYLYRKPRSNCLLCRLLPPDEKDEKYPNSQVYKLDIGGNP